MADHEIAYQSYIRSPEWRVRRNNWIAAIRPYYCWSCGGPWTRADNVHHLSYAGLGCERDADLVPLCRSCHSAVHDRYEELKRSGGPQSIKAVSYWVRDLYRQLEPRRRPNRQPRQYVGPGTNRRKGRQGATIVPIKRGEA